MQAVASGLCLSGHPVLVLLGTPKAWMRRARHGVSRQGVKRWERLRARGVSGQE
jgi:hypothetical protein